MGCGTDERTDGNQYTPQQLRCAGGIMSNSSPPSATYIRQWTGSSLAQVMLCRLFGANPLPEPMLTYCQLDPLEKKLQWNLNQNTKLFIAFDNVVCEMAAILSREEWVNNSLGPSDTIWRQRSESTLAQAMASCLTAPSHCLNHCWLIISGVLWHSSDNNFMGST